MAQEQTILCLPVAIHLEPDVLARGWLKGSIVKQFTELGQRLFIVLHLDVLVPDKEGVQWAALPEHPTKDILVPACAATTDLTDYSLLHMLLMHLQQGTLMHALDVGFEILKLFHVFPLHVFFDLVTNQVLATELLDDPSRVRIWQFRWEFHVGLHLIVLFLI